MTDKHHPYARFWKCALQVNPAGYSDTYRGQAHGLSEDDYLSEMLRACKESNIKVVGLADHGSVEDVDKIRNYLNPHGIIVFPGFEISSTERVHMVCLFAEDIETEYLRRVLGKLDLTDPEQKVKPSQLGCLNIASIVQEQGGFWFAAHMTGGNGLLRLNKDSGGLSHIWKVHDLVRAGQIPGPVKDLPENYKQIVTNKDPNYKRDIKVALINAKDVVKPDDLRNSRASTFIKMTRPCFASFLMAFKDPESRVRLVDDMVERSYSTIDHIAIEGGYFDGLSIKLSGHLNTVIGGRGTGKSTLLECIRYALDLSHKGEDARREGERIISANLGRPKGRVTLKLRSASNHMKTYTVVRRYGEPPRVIDQEGNESRLHPGRDLLPGIEIYGQNEIYELAKSPGTLTRVLDRFLPDSEEHDSGLRAAYQKLRENGERLVKVREQKDEAERQVTQLPRLEEQLRLFREQGLEERLQQLPLLEKERQLGPKMQEEVGQVRSCQRGMAESLPDLVFLSDEALEGLPHADLLRGGRQALEQLAATLNQKLSEIDRAVEEVDTALGAVIEELTKAMAAAQGQIEKEFAKLPAVAGKDGKEVGHDYQRLLQNIERAKPVQVTLRDMDARVKDLEQTRRNLLGEISDIRSTRTVAKQRTVKILNRRLAGKLRIISVPDGLRRSLRDFLQRLPGVGERKTEWVDESEDLTILGLVDAIREGEEALLGKNWGLTSGLAEILTRMTADQFYDLEGIDLQDRITLELNIAHEREQYKSLDRLSIGQQCTAILHLLLLDNQDPLVMDQPEDNLDNAFIAERIVKELRSAKTERQFLFATHNANIPVFGDAEWIGVCTALGDHAEMPADVQGSIDIPVIRDQVATLLEGGRKAFMQRKEKYGFDY